MRRSHTHSFAVVLCLLLQSSAKSAPAEFFKITVVDDATGRGVPLVELRTVSNIRYVTDSNGVVAFREPGLMDKTVFFHVSSHGYEFPKDGFGIRGTRLKVTVGASAVLKIKRLNVAERLYRVTGGGIYRDSLLTATKVPIKEPLLNARVLGQDSVVNAVYRGKIHWFWGDTNRPSYPLGNFHVPGATSALPAKEGLDPERGVNLSYYVDKKGFARPTAQMPGKGPTWIGGLVVLRDHNGRERLFAEYAKIAKPMKVYERGLIVFNDTEKRFDLVRMLDLNAPALPGGHPFLHTVDGVPYVYFNKGFPLTRVKATPTALADLKQYEAYSPFKKGSRAKTITLDRDSAGRLRYSWKTDTIPIDQKLQRQLIDAGRMKPEEALLNLRDIDTGKTVQAHGGSVYWNTYRKRWVMIALEVLGSSMLGEIWYAEAQSPVGPWTYARKIVTHDKYSFYNPKQHPMFDKDSGRTIFFEGTYTTTFSGNEHPTPRYDYNQIMYRIDLADKRLALPVPVYANATSAGTTTLTLKPAGASREQMGEITFFALDRPGRETVAVFSDRRNNGQQTLTLTPHAARNKRRRPLFHAISADTKTPPKTTTPLYEYRHESSGDRVYSTQARLKRPGYRRVPRAICRVWINPSTVPFPIEPQRSGELR